MSQLKKLSSFSSLIRKRKVKAGRQDYSPPTNETTEKLRYSLFGLSEARYPPGWQDPKVKVEYADSNIDRHLLGIFMSRMAATTATPMQQPVNYDNFVKLCFDAIRGKNATEQTKQSLEVMRSFLPPKGDQAFRILFPAGKTSYEINAAITKAVFSWLVGPIEIETTSENDDHVDMRTKVKIKKCRWLQESSCTGMCVNMCKRPTQKFFTEEFGLPLTIKPNLDDKSCEFCFGLTPPPLEEDPAYTYPCHVLCESGVLDDSKPCRKLPLVED